MTTVATMALALIITLCALPACAQQGDAAARTRALELFRESAELYRQGRFADAADRLREARELHSEPLLSYNLARALEGAGDLEGALEAYRDYLEEAPDADDAPAVRARLESLERHVAEVRALEEERERLRREDRETPDPTPPSTPPSRGPDVVPWVIAGSGAAVLIGGAVVGGLALARNNDAMRAPTHAAAVEASQDADSLAIAANVLLITGGLAALVGTIWGSIDLVSNAGEEQEGARVSLRIGPGSLAIDGAF
ncbi:tetratricopeptide repeat protein [Sandaracinus amylolyticus]|uniref:tetratricopeptide repeat protein n=1 Tax=Sandaracinus amylolyticus TaxID=927083 RepID=UPI001F44C818|nr:tetratricopeptide repeat protein [Sandaracinus amylolyticus]